MAFSKVWLDIPAAETCPYSGISVHGDMIRIYDPVMETAKEEAKRQLSELFPSIPIVDMYTDEKADTLVIELSTAGMQASEGYSIVKKGNRVQVTGSDSAGVLYGVFAVVRLFRINGAEADFSEECAPSKNLRMLDHWDNIDGSIERGYSGLSFFFKDEKILSDERVEFYARMLASSGYNAIALNNVNVRGKARELITVTYLDRIEALGRIFSRYNVRIFLSVFFSAPKALGDLDTADPLDENVCRWWAERAAVLFEHVQGFGGFLVKADSEGESGPFEYGRTHADGANMLSDAVMPYGGLVIWRCFVYNCRVDWRNKKSDRARAAFDHFMPIDGEFKENVILQIKNGPMDFQIREPLHPLFGGLKKTPMCIEFQLAQEYTGQQIDLCCLLPMIYDLLHEDTYAEEGGRQVLERVSGIAAVSNTGDDFCWTGDYLAGVNFYGFGRLCFDASLTPEDIIREWCRLQFADPEVEMTLLPMLLSSREVYERYTAPLGLGWLCTPSLHYGPSPLGYEFDRWGTYHYADRDAVGYDRSHTGSGYAGLYNEPLASLYDDPKTCPEELLLFFHRVRYDHVLKSGKTLIQHIYDTHFQGYLEAEEFLHNWEGLKNRVPTEIYENVHERFLRQLHNAGEWRDIINSFFYRYSGIKDEQGREIF